MERPGSCKNQQERGSRGIRSLKREKERETDGGRESLRRNKEVWDKSKVYSIPERRAKV